MMTYWQAVHDHLDRSEKASLAGNRPEALRQAVLAEKAARELVAWMVAPPKDEKWPTPPRTR